MQVALALQYFPLDGASDPVTVHVSTDPDLMLAFRRRLLREAESRRRLAPDGAVAVIERAEEDRLRAVLDLLVPEESVR